MGKKSKKIISKKLADLTLDIIIEILKRLPVKPLIRFKCVNKTFLNLISSPKFIEEHLKLSLDDPNLAHFRLIFTSVHPHLDLKSCSLQSVLNVEPDNAVELDYPLNDPEHSVWIVGSFNGLVCIVVEEDNLFIWNPATRVSKRLPNKGLELSDASFKIYACGFDERINDFKVVGIFYLIADDETYDIVVRLYSLRTDYWKTLVEFPTGHPVDEPAKFANGSLHWAVNEGVFSDFKWVIVSLDLETEMYGEIEQPNYGPDAFDLTLGVLKGCICVLSNFEDVRSDLWIMKEYGVKSSWAKLCSIPYVGDPGNFWYSFPIWISSSGELLMEFKTSLVIYNPRDSTFKYPEVNDLNDFLEARTYVESLVAPNLDEPQMVEEP